MNTVIHECIKSALYTQLKGFSYHFILFVHPYVHTEVEVGFNQSHLIVSEGTSTEAMVCTEVTMGILERNITVYLETITVPNSGKLN